MGKSLIGKELGEGISQRKDSLYQARFTNRFGKRQTIYAKTLAEIRQKLRTMQYEDEKALNIVSSEITLDGWFDVWLNTYKNNCRNSTKETYRTHYKRIQKELGWRKLQSINLIMMQEAINQLHTDNERKNSKKILVDMFKKAMATDLIIKNVAEQINTVITKEEKKERRVLTKEETRIFLEKSKSTFYHNFFVLALETGMRIGELCGLMWENVDLDKKVLYVNHTLCYFSKDGKYIFEMHDTKTKNSKRVIPLTEKAIRALRKQKIQKQEIILKGKEPKAGFENLVFVTKNNKPTQQFLVQECIKLLMKQINNEKPNFEFLTPHTFRHTFATRAIESGMRPKTLQKILGHGTLQMTMDFYCHVTDDSLFEEMQLFEKMCV